MARACVICEIIYFMLLNSIFLPPFTFSYYSQSVQQGAAAGLTHSQHNLYGEYREIRKERIFSNIQILQLNGGALSYRMFCLF